MITKQTQKEGSSGPELFRHKIQQLKPVYPSLSNTTRITKYKITDLLLEMFLGPVDLVGNGATVHLDLHDVRLLLAVLHQLHLKRNGKAIIE